MTGESGGKMVFDREDAVFQVVCDASRHCSLWPDYKAIPGDWRAIGIKGLKRECLAYIKQHLLGTRHLCPPPACGQGEMI